MPVSFQTSDLSGAMENGGHYEAEAEARLTPLLCDLNMGPAARVTRNFTTYRLLCTKTEIPAVIILNTQLQQMLVAYVDNKKQAATDQSALLTHRVSTTCYSSGTSLH